MVNEHDLIASGEFDSRLRLENSAGVVTDFVMVHNKVRLYDNGVLGNSDPVVHRYRLVWATGRSGHENVTIIDTDSNDKVIDVDGVFVLPKQIYDFLENQGFDLSRFST